jgi:hypothetical protein
VERKRELRLTAEVSTWLTTLPPQTLARVTAGMNRVQRGGSTLGRPDVDHIKGSRHHKMKELRIGTVRVLFAFDAGDPLMLTGGDKRGSWNQFYGPKIKEADRLYDEYRRDNERGGSSRHRNPPSHGR